MHWLRWVLCFAMLGCDGGGDPDAGFDAGPPDAGPGDAGPPDSGGADAGDGCEGLAFAWGRGGPSMLPGTDCLECHREGGDANTHFTVAGTVFESTSCRRGVEGAIVRVTDSTGATLELTTAEVGNFFSDEPLVAPLRFSVEVAGVERTMATRVDEGSCASCHADGSTLGLLSITP